MHSAVGTGLADRHPIDNKPVATDEAAITKAKEAWASIADKSSWHSSNSLKQYKGFMWNGRGVFVCVYKMKVFLIVICVLVALWAGLFAAGYHFDNRKLHYASVADARHAGELGDDRAIPELLLPDNATDIVLQYNIDTNERWLTYAFPAPQLVRLPGCTLDTNLDIRVSWEPWWWSFAIARLAKTAEKYRCVDRAELQGYWVEFNCVLVQVLAAA